MLLEEYEYELRRIEGKNNVIADTISRLSMLKSNTSPCYWNILEKSTQLFKGKLSDTENKLDNKDRIILPDNSKTFILRKLHEDLAHRGSRKLYLTINKYVTANKLKRSVEDITKSCYNCQVNKKSRTKLGLHTVYLYSETPFEYVSSDIYGTIKSSHFNTKMKHESFYIIIFTDICGRFTRVFIIKNIKSSSIIKKFKKWLEVYPTPLRFLSDNGR
ncbi:Transposon Tf2-9 polyprotein [Dictyocoela muelleri]|nr:Transposon Tf2-9 polyprotein [Dictyocoela muelleri]